MVPAISSLNALTDEIKSMEKVKDICRAEYDSVKSKLDILQKDFDPKIYQSKLDLIFQHYYKKEYLVRDSSHVFSKIIISELRNFTLVSKSGSTVEFNFLNKGEQNTFRINFAKKTLKIPELILLLFHDSYLKMHFTKYDKKMRTRNVFGKMVTIPFIFDLTGASADIDFCDVSDRDSDSEEYDGDSYSDEDE
jgi:hypothetical protein